VGKLQAILENSSCAQDLTVPHTHRWPGDGRPPGIYCTGHLRNGDACRQMLASDVGGGEFVVTRDRLIARVGDVRSIRCPICSTDNCVSVPPPQAALIIQRTEALECAILTGASNGAYA